MNGPPVWGRFDQCMLDAAYNNSDAVTDSAELLQELTRQSAAFRAEYANELDIAYGKLPRQKFDLFRSPISNGALFVFIHGGYWQRNSKDMFAVLADGPLKAGFDVAMIGYTLAPEASLTEIVAEVFAALNVLHAPANPLGLTLSKTFVSGWSAGGHLAARALEHENVDGALSISGIFDLEPIRHSYLNAKLRLTEAEVIEQSPMQRIEKATKPIALVVGGDELAELQRQSVDFGAARRKQDLPTQVLTLTGRNHFTIIDELREPDGAILQTLIEMDRGNDQLRPGPTLQVLV